jgi:hypothetical protein
MVCEGIDKDEEEEDDDDDDDDDDEVEEEGAGGLLGMIEGFRDGGAAEGDGRTIGGGG